jgi:hypothetical protein
MNCNTGDNERSAQLLLNLATWRPRLVPVESIVADVSRWGHTKWSDGETYTTVRAALDAVKQRGNNVQDAMIGEVALKDGFTLVTGDKLLADTIEAMGGAVMRFTS